LPCREALIDFIAAYSKAGAESDERGGGQGWGEGLGQWGRPPSALS